MKTLISIDPGVSSAIAVFDYTDTTPAKLREVDQFRGGTEVLMERFEDLVERCAYFDIICEDFQARPQTGFSYTTASLEPLVAIGALLGGGWINRRDKTQMVSPKFQYFAGDGSKKAQHAWLKEVGLYYTNKNFPDSPAKDHADDARSAMAHGIAWFRRKRHIPTINHYFKENND